MKYVVLPLLVVSILCACSSAASTSTPTAVATTIGNGPYQLSIQFESMDDKVFACGVDLAEKEKIAVTTTSRLTSEPPGVVRMLSFDQSIAQVNEQTDALVAAFRQCQMNGAAIEAAAHGFSWSLSHLPAQ